jgi:hypothetical protein
MLDPVWMLSATKPPTFMQLAARKAGAALLGAAHRSMHDWERLKKDIS